MREIINLIAEWAVMISGTAVLVVAAVALCWWAADVVVKSLGLFPIFQEFAEWRRRNRR